MVSLSKLYHPNYTANEYEKIKFRLTMEGGQAFIDEYLKKVNSKETEAEFQVRKSVTYNPAFAKATLVDVRNNIFSRMIDISRDGGSTLYQSSIAGEEKGVDLKGSSMTAFIGQSILLELMSLGRIGVYIDRATIPSSATLLDTMEKPPYLYTYKCEDIHHWTYGKDGKLSALKLAETKKVMNSEYDFIESVSEGYRLLEKKGDSVTVKFFDNNDIQQGVTTVLPLTEIPFVIFELENSLLRDVADYQIALLNLSSSDLNYALKSNFPFYIEQQKQAMKNNVKEGEPTVKIGPMQGRGYSEGLNAPAFIAPPDSPIRVSMDKQDQMKKEIRELVNVALLTLGDGRGLESGLGYIALELERGEREIAKIWSEYEDDEPATIKYPNNYQLKTDKDRYDEVDQLGKIRSEVPSLEFKKALSKQMVETALSGKVDVFTLQKIYKEIDDAQVIVVNPDKIIADFEAGLVSAETASVASGYGPDEYKQAQIDKIKRTEELMLAQQKFGRLGVDNNTRQSNTTVDQNAPVSNLGARGADTTPAGKAQAVAEKKVNQTVKGK